MFTSFCDSADSFLSRIEQVFISGVMGFDSVFDIYLHPDRHLRFGYVVCHDNLFVIDKLRWKKQLCLFMGKILKRVFRLR